MEQEGARKEERREIYKLGGALCPPLSSLCPLSVDLFLLSPVPLAWLPPSLLGCFSVFCSLAPSLFLRLLCPHRTVPAARVSGSLCLTLLSCPVCVCGSLSRPFLCAVPAAGERIMGQATLPFILCQARAGTPVPGSQASREPASMAPSRREEWGVRVGAGPSAGEAGPGWP